jgi:hypothetical protein
MSYGKLRNREVFKAEVNGNSYTFTCYTQDTSYGFRHICCEGFSNTDVCRYVKNDIIAKATYLNRTWERFTYETVLRNAIEKLPKADQQGLHDILIERKAQAEHEQAEKEIEAFKALYDKTSDTFKERIANSNIVMNDERDVNLVKGLMALDIVFNS